MEPIGKQSKDAWVMFNHAVPAIEPTGLVVPEMTSVQIVEQRPAAGQTVVWTPLATLVISDQETDYRVLPND